eukprot:SAG31_NODE_15974_length_728_cov_10.190779_1_plen_107_part_10
MRGMLMAITMACVAASMVGSAGALLSTLAEFRADTPSLGCDASSIVSKHEGRRKCVYTDTTGHKTIGVGYNLDQPGAKFMIASVGADFDKVYSGKQCLNDKQIDQIL